jgi:hypothetical protein
VLDRRRVQPADREAGDVVRLPRVADEGAHRGDAALDQPIERFAGAVPQGSLQTLPRERRVVRVERLGDAVGVAIERVARR